jgi:hypothetical protein
LVGLACGPTKVGPYCGTARRQRKRGAGRSLLLVVHRAIGAPMRHDETGAIDLQGFVLEEHLLDRVAVDFEIL